MPSTPDTEHTYARFLRAAAAVAAALVFALAAYVAARVLVRLLPMTMAIVVALLLAALLGPVTGRLRRWGVPATPAALCGVVGLLGLLAAVSYLIGRRAADQLDDLRVQVGQGLRRLRESLLDTLPYLDERRLDSLVAGVQQAVRETLPSPVAGATGAAEVLAGILLAVILLFFFLRDGEGMWRWLTARLPRSRAGRVDRAGRSAWHTLASYTYGMAAVAAVDAIGIGAALFLLGVPLALSLSVLTFLSAFVPIIGATLAGAAAALVTLVTNGPADALIVVAAVIVVQQLEGNLLQPIVMRRAVRLHPVVTLLAVTAGTLLGGIPGALIAVPLCAVVYHAAVGYRAEPAPEAPAADSPDGDRPEPTADAAQTDPPEGDRPGTGRDGGRAAET